MNPVISVTAGILQNQGRVLAAKRGPGDSLAGLWEFPGGKTKHGETLGQCLVRELREELGIRVMEYSPFDESYYEYGIKRIHLFAYTVDRYAGAPSALVHEEIEWITVANIAGYKFAPADVPFVRRLENRRNR
ncbi:MAG: 8-oxo-dGTP diphosphatase MutT [Spirochaetales bacterium]|jgi:mutator protein MutT|nr:8-oxo-dGTP diphosphatase MutT [Spirochaetales bacterium]